MNLPIDPAADAGAFAGAAAEGTGTEICWVPVPGGVCQYGDARRPRTVPDLLVALTPLTRGQARQLVDGPIDNMADQAEHRQGEDQRRHDVALSSTALPVTHVTFAQATGLAAAVGGRLPTSVEWEWIAGGPQRWRYPWGEEAWTPERALLSGNRAAAALGEHAPASPGSSTLPEPVRTPTEPEPVGLHPGGRNWWGLLDLAGNVWEWTATPVMGRGRIIRGGSYASSPLYARTTFVNAVPEEHASAGISLRPVIQS